MKPSKAAQLLGSLGGLASAAALTAEQRKARATKAGLAPRVRAGRKPKQSKHDK